MAFTYVEANSNIGNSDYLSAVRSALQDTVSAEAEFTDAEITAQYNSTSSSDVQKIRNLTTAVLVGRLLARRYAKQASFSSQGTSIQLLDRAKYWQTIVAELEGDLQVAQMEAGNTDQGGILYAGRTTNFEDQTGLALGLGYGNSGGSLGGRLV